MLHSKNINILLVADSAVPGATNCPVTGKLVQCLRRHQPLSDDVLNLRFAVFNVPHLTSSPRLVHCFSSYFYQRLSVVGFKSVRNWPRKANKLQLSSLESLFFPMHSTIDGYGHWTLGAVDFKRKTIVFYDPRQNVEETDPEPVFTNIRAYLAEEAAYNTTSPDLNLDDWTNSILATADKQTNAFDCGVFVCAMAEYLMDGHDVPFTKKDMQLFRWKILHAITSPQPLN